MQVTTEDAEKPVIHVDFRSGRLGNKMLQYMAAIALARYIGGCRLSGIRIPEWGIDIPEVHQTNPRVLRISSNTTKKLDMKEIVSAVRCGVVNRVELNIYSSHLGNLLSAEVYKTSFRYEGSVEGFGPEKLLIHIRGDDVLRVAHKQYTVLPIGFYRELISQTGLSPVFIGQLDGTSNYIRGLRDAFPEALFHPPHEVVEDFTMIRKSKNIVMSVSTFCWLAAWLSEADRVFMPLSGFLNPLQYPQADLIPGDDERYVFYLFPTNFAVPDRKIEKAHQSMNGKWRKVTYEELKSLRGA